MILMLFVLLLGPTVFLLQTYVQNTGAYLSDIVNKTFNLYAYEPTDWIGGWTLLYWAGGCPGRPSWVCSSHVFREGGPSGSSSAAYCSCLRVSPCCG